MVSCCIVYHIERRGERPLVVLPWFDHELDVRVVLWYRKEATRLFVVEEFTLSLDIIYEE